MGVMLAAVQLPQPGLADEPSEKQIQLAKTFVSQMAAGDFEKAIQPFDETMKKAMPAEKLRQVWESVTGQQGSFKQLGGTRTEAIQKYQIIFVTTEFERGKLDTKVVFDTENHIAGLFFVPAGKYESPAYVKSATFDEVEITVGKGLIAVIGNAFGAEGRWPISCRRLGSRIRTARQRRNNWSQQAVP